MSASRRHCGFQAVILFLIAVSTTQVAVPSAAVSTSESVTTVYPTKYFEVRNHDAPTKYVFNGSTRIARITGSLTQNQRIQRLRVYPGWNLCSLAVNAPNALAQLQHLNPALIRSAYKWFPASSNWVALVPEETVAAGTVVWLAALSNAVLTVTGSYVEPASRTVSAGGTFLPSTGLEVWPLANHLPPDLTAWLRASLTNEWLVRFSPELSSQSASNFCLAPGQAVFVRSDTATVAQAPDPALRICYYLEDHLGSSSAVVDTEGSLVEETAYYPFGAFRNEFRPRALEDPYHFTQKERDCESGLEYFGKRFYQPILGRWLSTDPKGQQGGGLNLYAYAKQNPLHYLDPDGGEIKVVKSFEKKTGVTTYTINLEGVVVSDAKQSTVTREQLEAFAGTLTTTIQQSYQGQEGKTRWITKVKLKVVDKVPSPDSKDHVFKIVDATVHGPAAAGTGWRGGRTMEIDTATFFGKPPGANATEAERKAYESPETVGAHEFGHAGGLGDRWTERKNLMSEDRWYDNATIEVGQLKQIVNEYNAKHLNLSDADAAKQKK
jgi:RHS repeat-associated protein